MNAFDIVCLFGSASLTLMMAASALLMRRAYLATRLKTFLLLAVGLSTATLGAASILGAAVIALSESTAPKSVFLTSGYGAVLSTLVLLMVAGYHGLFSEFADVRQLVRNTSISEWYRGELRSHPRTTHRRSSIEKRKGVMLALFLLIYLLVWVASSEFLRISLQMKEPLALVMVGALAACCAAVAILSLIYGDSGSSSGTS